MGNARIPWNISKIQEHKMRKSIAHVWLPHSGIAAPSANGLKREDLETQQRFTNTTPDLVMTCIWWCAKPRHSIILCWNLTQLFFMRIDRRDSYIALMVLHCTNKSTTGQENLIYNIWLTVQQHIECGDHAVILNTTIGFAAIWSFVKFNLK